MRYQVKLHKQGLVNRKKRDSAIEALNRIDQFACLAVEDNDNGEAEQLAKDYKLVFNYIQKK